ncbi:hypothetical protein Tco_1323655, partial [Tanacetum coccineum]
AHESDQELDEEQLAFLPDPRVADSQDTQTTIPHNAAFQTADLDAYDSNCDDLSSAKAVLIANLTCYGSNVISEVPHSEISQNDMANQSVQEMQYFEQTPIADYPDNENPLYLKKAQWIRPTLYDVIMISKRHDVISVVDEEETLLLEEKSQ